MSVFTVDHDVIPEVAVPGKRLGRHRWHDSRSRAYAFPAAERAETLVSAVHERHIGILDQGDVGSCTGEAQTGDLATSPVWEGLPPGHALLDQPFAYGLYSDAEDIDGDGPYPPNDNGSYGLSVAKAAKNRGLISGYQHAFSLAAMQNALQKYPVIVGTNWHTSMDTPDSRGLVTVSGDVRGGHEYLCREIDMANGLFWFDNSWGPGFGVSGRFCMLFADFGILLAEGGDVTISLPAAGPPPAPVPDWTHPDITFGHDQRAIDWAMAAQPSPGTLPTDAQYAAQEYLAWRHARGYR